MACRAADAAGKAARNRRIRSRSSARASTSRAAKDIAKLTWQTTPGTIVLQSAGAVHHGTMLPIVTTYFAAQTTTALGNAFAGDPTAGGKRDHVRDHHRRASDSSSPAGAASSSTCSDSMRYALEAKVSDIMYERFLSLEFWRYDDKDTIDIYDRAQRFSQFYAMGVQLRWRGLVSQVITLVASIIALLLVSWWIALILLVAIVPGVYLQFRLSREQIQHWNRTVDARRAKGTIERGLFQPEHIAELRLYGIAIP